jgi:hypothetical protein
VVHETATPAAGQATTTETKAWGVLLKLGFYLDIPVRSLRSAVGIGLAPGGMGGEAVAPSEGGTDGVTGIGVKGTEVRLDVAAPVFLIGTIQPRLSLIYTGLSTLSVTRPDADGDGDDEVVEADASGSSWFLGASIGGHGRGSTVLFSVGLQRTHGVTAAAPEGAQPVDRFAMSAWGAGARLLLSWTPSGKFMQYYTPAPYEPQQRGNAGCYYADHCDVDGHCTTQWTCL